MNTHFLVRTAVVLVLLASHLTAQDGPPVPRTWSGAPGGAWNVASNWNPAGVPDGNDTATIGPDSGEIVGPPGGVIKVGQLVLQPSTDTNPADDTVLRGNPSLKIIAGAGGVQNGARCTLTGAPGTNGVAAAPPAPGIGATAGGDVEIRSGGDVVNDGEMRGGNAGSAPDSIEGRAGGTVSIWCKRLFNHGLIKGGTGSSKVGAAGGCTNGIARGGDGGDVSVHTTENGSELGNLEGGDIMSAPTPGTPGDVRRTGKAAAETNGTIKRGDRIALQSDGTLDFSGAAAGAVIADQSIRVHAPTLILTGIPAGTHVFQAPMICFRCDTILLDPGVVLVDLCSGATHLGPASCAAESSFEMFGPEGFDDAVLAAPPGWSVQTMQGSTGFLFDNPANLPLHPNFGCHAAIANAGMSGPGPVLCSITTPVVSLPANTSGPVFLEFAQQYQPCPCPNSSAQVTVNVDGAPVTVMNLTGPTPVYDFRQIDITPFLPGGPGNHVLTTTFTYSTGFNVGFWILDDVTFRIPWIGLPGQAPQPGVALLDVNDARNANNVPPYFGLPGPYFTQVGVGEIATVHVAGPPNQPVVIGTGLLLPGITPLPPFGTLDLDPLSLVLVEPLFATPPFGPLTLPVLIPPPLSGLTLGLQAAVVQPGGGVGLTNAVEVRFGP